jgi:flagellar biosynthesis protein FlhG
MKRMIHRKIGQVIRPHGKIDLLTKWTIGRNGHKNNSGHIGDFLSYLRDVDGGLGKQVDAALSRLKVKIILNQVRTREDVQLGNSISYLAKRFIGLDVEYTGYIPFDIKVNLAAKKFQPLMTFYPDSNVVKGLNSVAKKLLS